MADLAKTSKVSVLFQCLMVLAVVIFSPVSESIEEHGGLMQIASEDGIKSSTIFIGLGVLSFAFVCQHGAFIVAGSLERPTKKRWAQTSFWALSLCVVLETACGVAGYLAFLDDTEGDILNNFLDVGGADMKRAANVARGLLCTTMFFVYPMDSFVCRHVLVVLFFRGRRAHEGDDASVLNRRDRRVAITLVVYLSSLVPALLVDNVGDVLAITGTIGASCLAYIGPGLIYMAVYGDEFLRKVDEIWGPSVGEHSEKRPLTGGDVESARLLTGTKSSVESNHSTSRVKQLVKGIAWHLTLMPIWCFIAEVGKKKLTEFQESKALKSPHISRLGKFASPQPQLEMKKPRAGSFDGPDGGLARPGSLPDFCPKMLPYGAVSGGNKAIGAAILAKKRLEGDLVKKTSQEEEVADVDVPPTWNDFCVAIFFIVFGMVALCAGMVSILLPSGV